MTHYRSITSLLGIALFCTISTLGCKAKKADSQPSDGQAADSVESEPTSLTEVAESSDSKPAGSRAGSPASAAPAAEQANSIRLPVDRLEFVVPSAWIVEQPTSSMRKAQLRLPGAGGAADAELVIYNFGSTPEAGGSVASNFDRWCNQFVQADGRDPKEVAARREAQVGGMAVYTIEISGRYVAAVRPGSPEKHDKPDHRMLGSVIISPEGKYFLKLLGPSSTVEEHAARYDGFLHSLKRN